MRRAFDPQLCLDCPPIAEVPLNTNCRDEIIPILRALQHLYADEQRRRELLRVVGKDVNGSTSRKHGRSGMSYWQIVVLAAVRLGCDLDYDKLQNLAEEHRTLRFIMGLGNWHDHVDFDWRRLQSNLTLLRPETLVKLNQLVVAVGHELQPTAPTAVRGDTFVVETNIHYPTDSSLIGDGVQKVVHLAAALAAAYELPGWRQHKQLLRGVRRQVQAIGRAARSKAKGAAARLASGYRQLLTQAQPLLDRAHALLAKPCLWSVSGEPWDARVLELQHYLALAERACTQARRRVLEGETLSNDEKLFSIFEPHTELINHGKQPQPLQFGHAVLVIEDAVGFICHYEVVGRGVLDAELVVPVMKQLQARLDGQIQRASFDRGFDSPDNQEQLAEIVPHPCLAKKGSHRGREQHEQATVEFRAARQRHPGIESAIGALQAGNGQERCRDRSERGFARYVGLGILGRNLHVLGKLLLAEDEADCLAGQSKRKRCSA